MADTTTQGPHAELCQRTIEAADNSMFKYLSFFAAIHAAAFTAVANDTVGLTAFLSELGTEPPHDPVILLLPGLAVFMTMLCYTAGRGLGDAGRTYAAAVQRAQRFGDDIGSFFAAVHGQPTLLRGAESSNLVSGEDRMFSRHHRASLAVTGVGVLWAGFFLGLAWGFPGPLSADPEPALEGVSFLVVSGLGIALAFVGLVFIGQVVARQIRVSRDLGG